MTRDDQRAAAQHLRKTTMLPVVESKAVGDKVIRIQGVAPHFENGWVKVWSGMRNLDVFVSEFVNFPNATHNDTLDALRHALQLAIKNAKYGVATW
jgi:predicted phage terminase large subunit-like protein